MDADGPRGGTGRRPFQVRPDGADSGHLHGKHEGRDGDVEPAGQPALEGVVGVHSCRSRSYGGQGRAPNNLKGKERHTRW